MILLKHGNAETKLKVRRLKAKRFEMDFGKKDGRLETKRLETVFV